MKGIVFRELVIRENVEDINEIILLDKKSAPHTYALIRLVRPLLDGEGVKHLIVLGRKSLGIEVDAAVLTVEAVLVNTCVGGCHIFAVNIDGVMRGCVLVVAVVEGRAVAA